MLPHWMYGNGRALILDFGLAEWDINQIGKCWNKCCKIAERLQNCIRLYNYIPDNIFPGYSETIKIVKHLTWNDPSIGTTTRSAHRWDNPKESPYYDSTVAYIEHENLDPAYIAIDIFHEYCHLVLPLDYNMHNSLVGKIFTSPPTGDSFTDVGIKLVAQGCNQLTSGIRMMMGTEVIIPHLVSPDNAVQPVGPPRSGGIRRLSDGKTLDQNIQLNFV